MENKESIKILIVEDNEIFRGMMSDRLKAAGYMTAFLESDATLHEVQNISPQVALVNITTPKEKGLHLIEEIRNDQALMHMHIIAIAKEERSVLVDHARTLGVKYIIDKVIFDGDDMLENVSALLRGEEKAQKSPLPAVLEQDVTGTVSDEKKESEGHILLIEDDGFMRDLFARSLRDSNFSVDDAADATLGEEMLAKHAPDLILLDLLLPGKSGFQFLSELKRNKNYINTPVIVVSNLGSKGDVDQALDLGAADFLVKANATIDEIVTKAKEHIKKSKSVPHLPKSVMDQG